MTAVGRQYPSRRRTLTGWSRPFSAGECAQKESVGTAKADEGIQYCNRDAGCLITVKNALLAIYRISADVNPADNLKFLWTIASTIHGDCGDYEDAPLDILRCTAMCAPVSRTVGNTVHRAVRSPVGTPRQPG
jgi:hypothetical protein